jgi:hypothetical protein
MEVSFARRPITDRQRDARPDPKNEYWYENPFWGAPKIYGELLKLGIKVAQSTVSIYMVPRRDRPLQTWKNFLRNHMEGIASIDLFVVPTIAFQQLIVFNAKAMHWWWANLKDKVFDRCWHLITSRRIISSMDKLLMDRTDYSVVVKNRAPLPNSWRWEIYRAGRSSPVEQSSIYFHTVVTANKAGKEALKRLLDKLHI